MLGTSEGTPERPCPGTAVPEWRCTWMSPVKDRPRSEGAIQKSLLAELTTSAA